MERQKRRQRGEERKRACCWEGRKGEAVEGEKMCEGEEGRNRRKERERTVKKARSEIEGKKENICPQSTLEGGKKTGG